MAKRRSRALAVGLLACAAITASLLAPPATAVSGTATNPAVHASEVSASAVHASARETRKGSGTPGMILNILATGQRPLRVWDPGAAWSGPGQRTYDPAAGWRTLVASTVPESDVDLQGMKPSFLGFHPIARWSPDGTRIAYVKTVADTGISRHPFQPQTSSRVTKHTAIFVYDLLTKSSRQVTSPPGGTEFCGPEHENVEVPPCTPSLGHLFTDFAPAWTADSSRIVFARFGYAADDDPRVRDSGYNLWSVPASGGAEVNLTHWDQSTAILATQDIVPIPGSTDVIARVVNSDADREELRRISAVASGSGSVIASRPAGTGPYFTDFGVSPDGSELVYLLKNFSSALGQAVVVPLGPGGRSRTIGNWPGSLARFSPTGNGILRAGCVTRPAGQACGITEFLLDDPGTHDPSTDDERIVYVSDELRQAALAPIVGVRPGFDIQTQQLPVIFLPGFAGSQITCAGQVEWLSLSPRVSGLRRISLGPDGLSSPLCPSAGPNGKLVEAVAAGVGDVYGSSANFVRNSFAGRGHVFGWDWRKAPDSSLLALNEKVRAVLAEDRYRRQGVSRVTLYGHSYGGLLIRQFIADSPRRVARVLTAGTPYWGSAKAIMPLPFGVEDMRRGPEESGLDAILPDGDFAFMARNLAGMYQLFPANAYGSWLTVDGKTQTMNGVSMFVKLHGGNPALLARSYQDRTKLYEGFDDKGGVIDIRAVAGTGLATYEKVSITTTLGGRRAALSVATSDGDGTVTDRSASQQASPTKPTKGAPVPVQRVCRIAHMKLSGAPEVTDAYQAFLDTGRLPLKTQGCPTGASKWTASYFFEQ